MKSYFLKLDKLNRYAKLGKCGCDQIRQRLKTGFEGATFLLTFIYIIKDPQIVELDAILELNQSILATDKAKQMLSHHQIR